MAERMLAIVVVYFNPSDYPGVYVARRQWACKGGVVEVEAQPLAVGSLDDVRAAVPPENDHWMPRQPADDPSILEVWL